LDSESEQETTNKQRSTKRKRGSHISSNQKCVPIHHTFHVSSNLFIY